MRKRKKIIIGALSVLLAVVQPLIGLAAEWQQDDQGWWYQYDNGHYAKNGIVQIGDARYIFDTNGYMLTGWQLVNARWYYLTADGSMAYGWQQIDGKWYYFSELGYMLTGWVEDGNKKYYLDENGVLKTGSYEVDGAWYMTDKKGVVIQNKVKKNTGGSGATLRSGSDGELFRYNELEKDWEYLPGKEESAELMMKKLFDDYLLYGNTYAFEEAARQNLAGLISDEDIEVFINDMEMEFMFDYDQDDSAYDENADLENSWFTYY